MNNEDYPGWNQYTDVSGTKVKDGIDISIAIPDNNPQSLNTFGGNTVSLTNQFLLSNLSWNPSNTNTNQITTNPASFRDKLQVSDNLTVSGDAFFDQNVTVNENLIIQDNNYLQIFKSEPFDQNFGNIPLAQIFIPFTGIPAQSIDSIAHANFEIIVKNNGLQTYSELHHIISGNISISIIYDNNTTILDDNIMINILHSSYSGDTPLIKRIFIEKNENLIL